MTTADHHSLLLVEDSDTQALQLQLMLEAQGFHVARAGSAEDALDQLNRTLPDLLIVDYRLPGMNGDELVRRVRLNNSTRALPVLMLTEESARDVERQGLDSGANAYIPKSEDNALLVVRLHALLRSRRKGDDDSGDAQRHSAFRRAEILLIEDSPTYRLFLADLLASEGYGVHVLDNVEACEARLARGDIDCVAIGLDIGRPESFALCRRLDHIRNDGPGNFEIIGLGGDERGELLIRGFAAGVDDMVPKSSERDTLLARVRAVIRRKFMRDEDQQIAASNRKRELALAQAQAEAASAEALSRANNELADANRRLQKTQAQLVQAAKMASLGELVAGIAHEINNPLAFILAHQTTVSRLVSAIEPCNEDDGQKLERARTRLEAIRTGLVRIQDLVLKLRSFSRLDEGEITTIDVHEGLNGVIALLGHKLKDEIVLERRFNGPATLQCSPALINQVAMNILSNAIDEIEGKGRIIIETDADDEDYRITISDSGPGIPQELHERIFEPFFTTKAVGVGTGLGLAISYSVVQSHGGSLEVGNGPDGGARFAISIPRTMSA